MSSSWAFLDSGLAGAEENMRIDASLFHSLLDDDSVLPVLRIYGFEKMSVTYGYSQMPEIEVEYEQVARLTGGGRVYHGEDLTYSVIARRKDHPEFNSVKESYLVFHEILQSAFSDLGIPAELHDREVWRVQDGACFVAPIHNDLLWQGKKIAGAAQKRSAGFFLHQGSVSLSPLMSDLQDYLNCFQKLKDALRRSFKKRLGIDWTSHPYSCKERAVVHG